MMKHKIWASIIKAGFGLSTLALAKFHDQFTSEMDFARRHPDEIYWNEKFTLFLSKSRARIIELPKQKRAIDIPE